MHSWKFTERNCVLNLSDKLLSELQYLAIEAQPNETGGTLVGNYSKDRRTATVKRILGVKTGGRQGPSWFYRPPDNVDRQLSEIYSKSKGRLYYLGEWHTHPRASASPSNRDLSTIRALAISASVATDTPLLMILGKDFAPQNIKCLLAESGGQILHGVHREV